MSTKFYRWLFSNWINRQKNVVIISGFTAKSSWNYYECVQLNAANRSNFITKKWFFSKLLSGDVQKRVYIHCTYLRFTYIYVYTENVILRSGRWGMLQFRKKNIEENLWIAKYKNKLEILQRKTNENLRQPYYRSSECTTRLSRKNVGMDRTRLAKSLVAESKLTEKRPKA